METTTEQVERKVDHGKVKTEEDIDIIAICQFQDCKLRSPLVIDFIIPNEFSVVVGKTNHYS